MVRSMLSRFVSLPLGAVAAAVLATAPAAADPPDLPPDLAAVAAKLERYRDPVAAVHDGYFSTLGCVVYAEGGMGIHFLNGQLMSPEVDPETPQLLIYEPDAEGQLHLVAAEWLVPLATGITERPSLFGQAFNGPMAGHLPLMPESLHHYDLHVWLFKANPAGLFSTINPDVTCEHADYRMLEEPPPTVPHH